VKPTVFPRRAAAALFVERQHLERPRSQRLGPASLTRFVEDVGGLQIDSINVVARAHYLTAWSRFGNYDPRALDRLLYRRRVLFEYWAHAACFVPVSLLAPWRRAMLDYEVGHTGWRSFLKKHGPLLATVEAAFRERGPLGISDFEQARPKGAAGWWSWRPAQHAIHYLWMSGRTMVHSREHFQKRFDLASRILPAIESVEPPSSAEFPLWHMRRSLHAMGAATETDLHMYLTFPRIKAVARRATLRAMLKSGEVVPVAIEGERAPWVALAEDVPHLERAARRRSAPSSGTTLLSPFDSFLWHRKRAQKLFGFDYTIEVYVPAPKRKYGYYVLPLWHDGQFIGRVDVKNNRQERVLEARRVHFEPWLLKNAAGPGAHWGALDADAALAGTGHALADLSRFLGAERVRLGPVTPAKARAPLVRALQRAMAGGGAHAKLAALEALAD